MPALKPRIKLLSALRKSPHRYTVIRAISQSVITSYSIHYTKLYDWRSLGAVGARQALPPGALAALADAVLHEQDDALLVAAIAALGEAAAHNRIGADVVLRIGQLSRERDSPAFYPTRITSYNVCYTKLLRGD